MLTGTAIALLAGARRSPPARPRAKTPRGDVRILNTALGAELEAIAAYQVGAESGLLQKPVLDLAVTFQGHHKAHAEVLAKTVEKLGGKPVAAKAKYTFPVEKLKSQDDVLKFAASLEKGAVSAYLGADPGVLRPRPRQGRRQHPRRRGDALGDPAQRRGRAPGPGGVRIVMRFAGAVFLARGARGRHVPSPRRRRTRRRGRRCIRAASPATRSRTTGPARVTAGSSAARREAARGSRIRRR